MPRTCPDCGRDISTRHKLAQRCSPCANKRAKQQRQQWWADGASARYYTTEHGCSCKAAQYRAKDGPCKHVRRLRNALAIVRTQQEHNDYVDFLREQERQHGGDR